MKNDEKSILEEKSIFLRQMFCLLQKQLSISKNMFKKFYIFYKAASNE